MPESDTRLFARKRGKVELQKPLQGMVPKSMVRQGTRNRSKAGCQQVWQGRVPENIKKCVPKLARWVESKTRAT